MSITTAYQLKKYFNSWQHGKLLGEEEVRGKVTLKFVTDSDICSTKSGCTMLPRLPEIVKLDSPFLLVFTFIQFTLFLLFLFFNYNFIVALFPFSTCFFQGHTYNFFIYIPVLFSRSSNILWI